MAVGIRLPSISASRPQRRREPGKPRAGSQILATGYFVSTVGRNEETIRAYIRNQEMAGKQLDQLHLKLS
jgi:REP element-mobilizing transposase RayT